MLRLYFLLLICWGPLTQLIGQINVMTVITDCSASGGLTLAPDGSIILSDFGTSLNQKDTTAIYCYQPKTGQITTYGSGFIGASGGTFGLDGSFYQANPRGNRISRRSPDGLWEMAWASDSLNIPIGMTTGDSGEVYVCNCGANNIVRIDPDRKVSLFASDTLFNCPNGLKRDGYGNLYACNFNDGRVLRINWEGKVEPWATLPSLPAGKITLGNGHLTWHDGQLFVVTIGTGELYVVTGKDQIHHLAGQANAMRNTDGVARESGFSKPNGLIATRTGDTLYLNCSGPSWQENPMALHPAPLRMISGVCSAEYVQCHDAVTKEAIKAIRANTIAFSQAYMRGDYEFMANAYLPDGKILPGGASIITGRKAIHQRWVEPAGTKTIFHKVHHEEIKILGDEAYDYGYYEGKTRRENGSVVAWKGKYVIVWKKADQDWKMYLDIWNRVNE